LEHERFLSALEDYIAHLQEKLSDLEAGRVQLGCRRRGGEWTDITIEMVHRERNTIAVFQSIIKTLREECSGNDL